MSTETSDKTLSGIFYLLTVMCLFYGMTDMGESVFKNSIARVIYKIKDCLFMVNSDFFKFKFC